MARHGAPRAARRAGAGSAPTERRAGTDWRRFALLGTSGLALMAGTLWATTATAAVPASFAVSGSTFTVTADRLQGQQAVQYASVTSGSKQERHPVAVAAINNARLHGLCQSSVTRTPFGPVTLTIRSGRERPVHAGNLVIDLQRLDGDLHFGQVRMGQDAGTLNAVPGAQGQAGAYGQQARSLTVDRLRVRAWSVTAGTFDLKDATMSISPGDTSCR